MSRQSKHFYEFGPFRIDLADRLLLREGEIVPLTPKAFEMLLVLVEDGGRVLEKEELMKRVWPDSFVEEANLSHHVFTLRKALGEDKGQYIQTVPRRGYRFVAQVTEISDESADLLVQERISSRIVIDEEQEIIPEASDLDAALSGQLTVEWATSKAKRWQPKHWIAISAVLALIIVSATWLRLSRSDSKALLPPPVSLPLTSFPDDEFDSALSPDGKFVAFAWTGGANSHAINIYVKQVGGGPPLRLTTNEGREGRPTWSPDGNFIAFIRHSRIEGGSGIFLVPALGGPERKLLSWFRLGDLSWSPDGKSIVFSSTGAVNEPYGLSLISVANNETHKLTSPPVGSWGDNRPAFSPDGQTVAFVRNIECCAVSDIYLMPVSGGEPKRLTFDNRRIIGVAWAADGGSLVFSSNRAGDYRLWMVSPSGGSPEQLEVGTENAYDPSISRQGNRLTYTRIFTDTNIYRVNRVNPMGHDPIPVRLIASSQKDSNPRLSADGKRIVFESTRTGNYEIWISESDGSNQIQLTSFGGPTVSNPCWSPDSRQVAFVSRPEGRAAIYVINTEGGPPHRLTAGPLNSVAPSWSKDGQWIYFGSDRGGSWQVWKMPAAGGEAIQVTKGGGYESVESPDGKYLYFNKYGFNTIGIFRVPVTGGEESMIVPVPQLNSFGDWTVTGEGIYFIHRYDTPVQPTLHYAVKLFSFATGKVTPVVALEKDPGSNPGLNISPDGQWIIFAREDYSNHDLVLVENFR